MMRNKGVFLIDMYTGHVYKDAVIYNNGYAVWRETTSHDTYLLMVQEWNYEDLTVAQKNIMREMEKQCTYIVVENGIPTDKKETIHADECRWFYTYKLVYKYDVSNEVKGSFASFFDATGDRDWTVDELKAVHWFTDVLYGFGDVPYYHYTNKVEFLKCTSPTYIPIKKRNR